MCVCVCVCVCVCETTWPNDATIHVEPPWDGGRKFFRFFFFQWSKSLLFFINFINLLEYGKGEFTINYFPQCRAFTRVLITES